MSIDRGELQDAARKAFGEEGLARAREESWQRLVEMGWLMMPIPEELDGLGFGREAVGAIHNELGRVLSPVPAAPTLAAIEAVAHADGFADRAGWLERMAAGELVTMSMLLAGPEASGVDSASPELSGTLQGVQDADRASHLLVITQARDLCALIPLDGEGVTVEQRAIWDESRHLFDVTLEAHRVAPQLIVARGDAVDTMAHRLKCALLFALAADSLGGADALLDLTVEYLKTRKQFDRPLAMFQALKHRCADLKTAIVAAEALLWSRAAAGDATATELGALKAHACRIYADVAEEAIQLHGGIGLTEEHECHLFMKRAMLNRVLCGDADLWEEHAGREALTGISIA